MASFTPTRPTASTRLSAYPIRRRVCADNFRAADTTAIRPQTGHGMNGLSRRRIAQAICRYGVRVAPPHRKALAEAMLAECDYVSNADALGFAAGCFISIAGWWLATAHGVNQSARLAVSAGAGAFALLALVVAARAWGNGSQIVALALVPIMLFYAVAAFLALKTILQSVGRHFLAGLGLNSLGLATVMMFPPESAGYSQFLRALVIEEYVILAMAFAFVQGARWIALRLGAQP